MVATLDDAALLRASFREGNIPKGVAWSPDGTCLLTATEDAQVRLYEVPARARVFFLPLSAARATAFSVTSLTPCKKQPPARMYRFIFLIGPMPR